MSRAVLGVLAAALLLVAACDSGGENGVENISGRWSGTVDHADTEYTVVIHRPKADFETYNGCP
jgi:hypothetical protein